MRRGGHLNMPRTAGAAASRFHGNAAGEVAVGARNDVDGIPRRNDVMSACRFHSTASLIWLRNNCTHESGHE